MSTKILYVDTETTGMSPIYHGIVELAIIVEIDGLIAEKHHFKARPFETDRINADSLKLLNLTIDEIKSYPDPNQMYWDLVKVLNKYVDRYDKDKTLKFFPVGYNVQFDLDFLQEFFRKNGDQFIGSYFNWRKMDVLQLLYLAHYKGQINLESYKLANVCEYFGIDLEAHDAMSDLVATRELFNKLEPKILVAAL